ncbi:hypothetical protein K503DRAFT_807202 [Rhizopogon vinicolor AM-OR11-026]|uniref:Uncharacterized protein n=2 Tax=Rhizopogon TaxID=5375 RepID=A0A1J8RIK1_9AGAM|nr:hypothetical protein K503DRAFT_807202 [Rhizopogon vinicolor AM-OR11-026]OJA21634.1 hypothetical protein AZE42_13321 [Rhizopogon vesiculosus]
MAPSSPSMRTSAYIVSSGYAAVMVTIIYCSIQVLSMWQRVLDTSRKHCSPPPPSDVPHLLLMFPWSPSPSDTPLLPQCLPPSDVLELVFPWQRNRPL